MNTFKKKIAFYLATFLIVFSAITIINPSNTFAATTKASLLDKTGSVSVNYGYATFVIKDANPKAVYTVSSSNKSIAEVSNMSYSSNYDSDSNKYTKNGSMQIHLNVYKKGTAKFVVKETLGKKTRKLGSYKLKVIASEKNTNPSNIYTFVEDYDYYTYTGNVSFPVGCNFNLFSSYILGSYSGTETLNDVYMYSSDQEILTVTNNGDVKTLKEGNASITIDFMELNYDYYDYDYVQSSITLNVTVDKSLSVKKKNDWYNNAVKALIDKKVTADNVSSYYNDYVELKNTSTEGFFINYDINIAKQKLVSYLDANSIFSVGGYTTTPECLTITRVSASKGVDYTLDNKLTKTDMIALLINTYGENGMKKYTSTTTATLNIVLSTESGYAFYIPTEVKEGDLSGTAQDIYGNLEYFSKGEKLYFTNYNKKTGKLTVGSVTLQ